MLVALDEGLSGHDRRSGRKRRPVSNCRGDEGRAIFRDIPEQEVSNDMWIRSKNRPWKAIAPLLSAVVLAPALPAPAAARADCLLDYVDCVEAASDLGTFPRRSIAGLVCYTNLINCLQRRLY
jgi:hypothetical protein